MVVDDIKQGNLAAYGAVLCEISDRSSVFLSCNIVHEFRSSNFEAHNLAKHALSLGGWSPCLVRPSRRSFLCPCKHFDELIRAL